MIKLVSHPEARPDWIELSLAQPSQDAPVESSPSVEDFVDALKAVSDLWDLAMWRDPQRAGHLESDLATAVRANGFHQLALDIFDARKRPLAQFRWNRRGDRVAGTSRRAKEANHAATYTVRIDRFTTRELSLAGATLRLPWQRHASAAPRDSISEKQSKTVRLRIIKTGKRGYAFANTLDGTQANVFCHIRHADPELQWQEGTEILARLIYTAKGIQCRDIRRG